MNQEILDYINKKIEDLNKQLESAKTPNDLIYTRAKKEAYVEIYNYLKNK